MCAFPTITERIRKKHNWKRESLISAKLAGLHPQLGDGAGEICRGHHRPSRDPMERKRGD
uniref:Uncharacterized protein n=1 Tax=Megaselia scalaris TaxID=36166 RepID=T1GI42_MEGSC